MMSLQGTKNKDVQGDQIKPVTEATLHRLEYRCALRFLACFLLKNISLENQVEKHDGQINPLGDLVGYEAVAV